MDLAKLWPAELLPVPPLDGGSSGGRPAAVPLVPLEDVGPFLAWDAVGEANTVWVLMID